jgi:hypothetical protein
MEKRGSLFGMAGSAAVAAGFLAMMRGGAPDAAGKAAQNAAKAPVAATDARLPGPIGGAQLVAEYLAAEPAPTDCRTPDKGCYDFDVLVATVPDPFDSHLDWMYDTQVEALRRAFERSGFVLDRFWLPWQGEAAALAGQPTQRDTAPGVLLFRGSTVGAGNRAALRLLYVVGESPAAGVHVRALGRALEERSRLLGAGRPWFVRGPAHDTLRVVGPSFSGSVLPLRRVLDLWLKSPGAGPAAQARVLTGSATRDDNVRVMEEGGRIRFAATVQPVGASLAAAETVLVGRMNLAPAQVAVLEESGTAFGQAVSMRGAGGMLHVTVPMNVAALRGETDDEPDPPLGLLPSRAATVRMDLRESGHPREGPTALSGLSAPTAGIMVDQLIEVLRRNDVRAVGLQFTDVRDQLFLAREIRRRMHDVQLFAFGSNALFLRADRTAALTGLLTFSTYPPLSEGRELSARAGTASRNRMLFADESAEGTFNAAVKQLGRGDLAVDYGTPVRAGLADPWRPPVWVSAVGRGAFVPVTVVDAPEASRAVVDPRPRPLGDAPAEEGRLQLDALDGLFVLGLMIFAVALQWVLGMGRRRGEILREVVLKVKGLAPVGGPQPRGFRWVAGRSRRRAWAKGDPRRPAPFPDVGPTSMPDAAAAVAHAFPLSVDEADATPVGAGQGAAAVATLPVPARPPALPGRAQWMAVLQAAARVRSYFGPPAEHAALRSAVQRGSLLLHREIYGLLRLIALAGAALPPMTLYVLASTPRPAVAVLMGVVTLAWTLAALCCVRLGWLVFISFLDEGRAWALRPGCMRVEEGRLWMLDVLGRTAVIAGGLFYYGNTLWYCWELVLLKRHQPLAFQLLFDRALQLGSGLSPLVPLFVAGLGYFVWGTWHAERVRLLSTHTVFEAGMLHLAAEARGHRASARPLRRRGARRTLEERVEQVREDLFLIVPSPLGVYIVLLLAMVGGGLLMRVGRTLESAAMLGATPYVAPLVVVLHGVLLLAAVCIPVLLLPPAVRRWVLPVALAVVGFAAWRGSMDDWFGSRYFTASSFDMLLAFTAGGTLVATTWGVYRLVTVWSSLRQVLCAAEDTPLRAAFGRIPGRIARLMRLTIFGSSPEQTVDAALAAQWQRLKDLYPRTTREVAGVLRGECARSLGELMSAPGDWKSRPPRCQAAQAGKRFRTMFSALKLLWAAEDSGVRVERVLRAGEEGDDPARLYPSRASGEWKRTAEDLLALELVDYVQWVMEQLHKLAVFLFLSLLLSTVLLSCYPFPGQSLVKLAFMVVLLVTVGALLLVMVQMNRDELLSRIGGTEPGKITWDSSFVLNGMMVGVVPLLALVSSEFPAVRQVLFAGLDPLVKSIFGG